MLKERDRDRGLRQARDITIETYINQRWTKELNGAQGQESEVSRMNWAAAVQHVNSPTAGSSRETTPRSGDESQPGGPQAAASKFPQEIGYFSGNPIVEVTKGLIHLYKKKQVYLIFHNDNRANRSVSANARPPRRLLPTSSACWPCPLLSTATIC